MDYDVTNEQIQELKIILKNFIPYIEKHQLIEIAKICSYTESFINLLPTATKITKQKFAYDIGLDIGELEQIINNFT